MNKLFITISIMLFACMVQAQESNFTQKLYLGYSTTLPTSPIGFNIGFKAGKGLIFYEIKFGTVNKGKFVEDYENYYSNISYAQASGWGDMMVNQEDFAQDKHMMMDLNYAYPVSRKFAVYGGLGIYSHTRYDRRYQNFSDPSGILGDNGSYWISNENFENTVVKQNAYGAFGIMYKSDGAFWAKTGVETHFVGFNIAIGAAF